MGGTPGRPHLGLVHGWFNLAGLVGVVASVVYASATFLNVVLGLYGVEVLGVDFGDSEHILGETFLLFAIILAIHATINIMRTHLLAITNSISVFVHVFGVVMIIAILVFVPDEHQSLDFVFTERINNSGFSMDMFWFYVLPLGFLLTQYTITGFDASAHVSEETHDASRSAARGVWQSIFYSAVIGWFVLLAITFAATDPDAVTAGEGYGAGSSLEIFSLSLSSAAFKAVVLISTHRPAVLRARLSDQRLADVLRLLAGPRAAGLEPPPKVNASGTPRNAVITMAVAALIITLPALKGNSAGDPFPFAFFAVVSITVIGLYIAYAIPIFLRWRAGSSFQQSPVWNLGNKWRWMNPFAVFWVGLITYLLPAVHACGWRRRRGEEFSWEALNYAPLTVGAVILSPRSPGSRARRTTSPARPATSRSTRR